MADLEYSKNFYNKNKHYKIRLYGYHGTSGESSQAIIKEDEFKISQKKDEWLGDGINRPLLGNK